MTVRRGRSHGRWVLAVLGLTLVLGAGSGGGAPGPGKPPVDATTGDPAKVAVEPDAVLIVGEVSEVARLAGAGSRDGTSERYGVHGTDLGHMVLHRGGLRMVFGDTFGPGRSNWRSSAMAIIPDPDPRNGLTITEFVADPDGVAIELLPSAKVDGREMTVIPTNATSVGDTLVLHWMSVRTWGAPGEWEVNRSGLATSDDDGRTWTVLAEPSWDGTSGFAQVAFARHGGWQYVMGIPAGRMGAAHVARVRPSAVLDAEAWSYWDGSTWQPDVAKAAAVIDGPVGELSLRWSTAYERWLLLYLDEDRSAVVLRTAETPVGPWTSAVPVLTAANHPTLYAPYLVPAGPSGPEVYFTLSRYDTYGVSLFRAELLPASPRWPGS